MQAIHLHSQVGSDGILRLEVPVTATNSDLDVLVIVQPGLQRRVILYRRRNGCRGSLRRLPVNGKASR